MSKLKRLLAPSFWKIQKKTFKWTVSPSPGPHAKFESIPLQILMRDILKIAETGKEAKTIIKKGEVFVDGKARKDHGYPVGLFDVISLPKTKQFYRIVPNVRGLQLINIPESEANVKVCKIDSKTVLKKGKMQLNLNDGKNIFVQNGKYKTGDSLLLGLPALKIIEHLPLEAGATGIVSKGVDAGKIGIVKELKQGKMREKPKIVCNLEGTTESILKERFFVLGKNKPMITVSV